MIQKAVITGGVSYHHALTTDPGSPLADCVPLDVYDLARADLSAYDLLVVLRSVDNEALWVRRHQVARFLDRGGVLVVFGEAWTNWFPGCRWEQEGPADLAQPLVGPHPLFQDVDGASMHWHGKGPRWCNHGHLVPPEAAEVLIGTPGGDAFVYVDRGSSNGVILAASNLDLDTHTFHGNATARQLLQRVLAWAEGEAARASERRARLAPTIAGLFSGVHFQRGFYADAEFGPSFSVVPVEELAGIDLLAFPAVWVPRESNQHLLVRHARKLENYLKAGGTLVSFEEMNQPWLRGATWEPRRVEPQTLTLAGHPMLSGLSARDVQWHAHGVYAPPSGAATLVGGQDGVALYLDEQTFAPGRVLAGTLDPDCHVGYGSDVPRPLVRALVRWALAARGPGEGSPWTRGSAEERLAPPAAAGA